MIKPNKLFLLLTFLSASATFASNSESRFVALTSSDDTENQKTTYGRLTSKNPIIELPSFETIETIRKALTSKDKSLQKYPINLNRFSGLVQYWLYNTTSNPIKEIKQIKISDDRSNSSSYKNFGNLYKYGYQDGDYFTTVKIIYGVDNDGTEPILVIKIPTAADLRIPKDARHMTGSDICSVITMALHN